MEYVTVTCRLVGIAPISFSKAVSTTKNSGETSDAYMERTWREHLHVGSDGIVFLPPGNLKNCLADVAGYLSESVPGKGMAKFTKHFEAGVMITTPMPMADAKANPIKASEVEGERLFLPSDGKKGGGKRVWKRYPMIPEGWQVQATILLIDPTLHKEQARVERYLTHAGQFIGMGRFRPRKGGYYGRFIVEDFEG